MTPGRCGSTRCVVPIPVAWRAPGASTTKAGAACPTRLTGRAGAAAASARRPKPVPRVLRSPLALPLPCRAGALALLLALPTAAQEGGGFDEELLREIERARAERAQEAEAEARKARRERAAREAAARSEQEREAAALEARQAELQELLDAELAVQQGLIERREQGAADERFRRLGAATLPREAELPESRRTAGDPRAAAPAPEDRVLPASIFEERAVSIAPGTWGNARELALRERRLDADGDGAPELVRWVERGSETRVRQQEDANLDGIPDTWSDYAEGRLVARVRDSNDDGNPDLWERYEEGRVADRQIDRDDDGVRDAFFRYEGDSLAEEWHDANNDGRVDLRIHYRERVPVRAEEDRDRDGRMDQWTTYAVVDDRELAVRVERDERGRGTPDTFDHFESVDGRAVLGRREEDRDGDGRIDVLSLYRGGRLVRREIADPEPVATQSGG